MPVTTDPTNVIVIMTDELRRDCVGAYGNPHIKTPHLDALAARGIALSMPPIRRRPFACRRARRSRRAVTCTKSAAGRMPSPTPGTPESWHHKLRAAGRETSPLSANSTSARRMTTTASPKRSSHCTSRAGRVGSMACCATRLDLFDASGFAASIGPGDDAFTLTSTTAVCDATVELAQVAHRCRPMAATASDPWGPLRLIPAAALPTHLPAGVLCRCTTPPRLPRPRPARSCERCRSPHSRWHAPGLRL